MERFGADSGRGVLTVGRHNRLLGTKEEAAANGECVNLGYGIRHIVRWTIKFSYHLYVCSGTPNVHSIFLSFFLKKTCERNDHVHSERTPRCFCNTSVTGYVA